MISEQYRKQLQPTEAANDLNYLQDEPKFRGENRTTGGPTDLKFQESVADVASVSRPKSYFFEPLAREGGLETTSTPGPSQSYFVVPASSGAISI